MNFERLDSQELASIGIRFETKEETQEFAELIREELEVRIGEEISKRSTKEQLDEFDRCNSPASAQRWLRKNCPDYGTIVLRKREELENEIIKYKSKISGIIPEPVPDPEGINLSGIKPWDGYLEEELYDDEFYDEDYAEDAL